MLQLHLVPGATLPTNNSPPRRRNHGRIIVATLYGLARHGHGMYILLLAMRHANKDRYGVLPPPAAEPLPAVQSWAAVVGNAVTGKIYGTSQ